MFNINQEIVCNIITKAREINIADDLTLPDDQDELSDAEWKQLLAEYQNDLSYQELKDLINELEPDQQQDIIALMYIGRGDFTKNEWKNASHQAHRIKRSNRAYYLISKSMLSDYLTEGLAAFGFTCDE
ncbi:MAG: DUF3775 domain-containing protein [Gammaproteobacteria bacterium]|nr:DUF3775 domain-containing protein [Gammaproteobacteria bacterium]